MMLGYLLVLATVITQFEPEVHTLQTEENVWDIAVHDLNLDGVKDILLLVNDETAFPPQKKIAVYIATEAGGYERASTVLLELPAETGAVFLAEIDGNAPKECVAVHGAGAMVFHYAADRFSMVNREQLNTLYPTNSREPCFIKNGAADLQHNGIEEWLLPTPQGLQVRGPDQDSITVTCDVVSEMRSGESLYIVHRLPDFQTFTLAGQQALGLAFLSDEFADFAYGEDWSQHKRIRLPMNLEEKWDASTTMKDITGDGFPDLVVTQTRGTVRMYAETQVYLAREPFVYPEKPDALFSASGAVSSPLVIDVNGDDMLDLLFIRIPFGVKNMVNFFVRGKIAVQAEVYLYNGEQYGEKADYKTSMTMDAPEGRERVAYAFGDFSGDGRLDVVYGSEQDTLAVYTGEPERFISARPWKEFEMPAFGTARTYDLNNNQAKDIILFRPGGDNAKRVDVIVF